MPKKRVSEHNRLYENCKALCKKKGISFMEFERTVLYRQPGYLSRGKTLTADELLRAADYLEVGMGALMTYDFKKEMEMLNTLQELKDNVYVLMQSMSKDDIVQAVIKAVNGEVDD